MSQYDELNRIFSRIYSPHEGERAIAAHMLYAAMERTRIHISDIKITAAHGAADSFERARTILETELRRTQAQLAFARRYLNDETIRAMDRIGGQINRWPEVERCLLGVIGSDGALPKDWKKRLADITGEPIYAIERWQEGLVPVPDAALKKLGMAVDAKDRTGWPELERLARQRWKDGKPWRPLLAKLVRVSDAEVARWEMGAAPVPANVLAKLRVQPTGKPLKSHIVILETLAPGRQPYLPIYNAMTEALNPEPTKRHPFAARMSDLVTGRLFGGKPLVRKIRIRSKVYEYEITPYGRQKGIEWGVISSRASPSDP